MALERKISEAKSNSSALVELLEQFTPLLNKYAKKLTADDAYAELQLKFIEIILGFAPGKMRSLEEPYILSYLNKSIHNHFIYLSKQEKLEKSVMPLSAMTPDEGETEFMDKLFPPVVDDVTCEELDFLRKTLTEYELEIIVAATFYRHAVKEIATHYGVSSAAICQAKKSAIKKLKKALKEMNK